MRKVGKFDKIVIWSLLGLSTFFIIAFLVIYWIVKNISFAP